MMHMEAMAAGGPQLVPSNGEDCLELGLMYATGREVPLDYVEAQKWFNVAVARGCRAAAERRRELAAEMSRTDLDAALRRAREWLRLH